VDERLDPTLVTHKQQLNADTPEPAIRMASIAQHAVVVCTDSFHWYRDQAHVVVGLAALMQPEGQLLIASIASVTNVGDSAVRQLVIRRRPADRALTPHRIKRLLTTAGFDVGHQPRVPRLGLVPWPVLTQARLRPTH